MSDTERRTRIVASISETLNWMSEGVTRYPTDSSYDPEKGSVQEKYGMTNSEARAYFKDARLKNARVSLPSRVVIAEDLAEEDVFDSPSTEPQAAFSGSEDGIMESDDLPMESADSGGTTTTVHLDSTRTSPGESPVVDDL